METVQQLTPRGEECKLREQGVWRHPQPGERL